MATASSISPMTLIKPRKGLILPYDKRDIIYHRRFFAPLASELYIVHLISRTQKVCLVFSFEGVHCIFCEIDKARRMA